MWKSEQEHIEAGMHWYTSGELPGVSVFLRDGDSVLHTYSTYSRGVDILLFTFNFLDLTPLRRQ